MKFIPLNKGYSAMVDDEDFEILSQWKWLVSIARNGTANPYAVRGVTKNKKKRTVFMHRQIMGFPDHKMDHIDGNSLNNQKSNLRAATSIQNGMNRKIQIHSTPYKGVHLFKATGKFQAYICVNKKLMHLGFYECAKEAARAYDRNAIMHFGEFARTNQQMGAL